MLTANEILKLKKRVRERDGNKCRHCGMTSFQHVLTFGRNLDVHRIIPGAPYAEDICVALCMDCHDKEPRRYINKIHDKMCAEFGIPVPILLWFPDADWSRLEQAANILGITPMQFVNRTINKIKRNLKRRVPLCKRKRPPAFV